MRSRLVLQFLGKLGLSLWLGSLTTALHADLAKQHQSFDRLMLPGGRAALLGGAYTAIASDPAGLLYNPAGVSFSPQNQISLNSWSNFRSQTVYEGAVLGRDFEENSITRFGGFVGALFQFKPFTLGYLIATPDNRKINQDDVFTDLSGNSGEVKNFTRIHQETNTHDLFGASLSVKLGNSWSLGGLALFYDRTIESMDYQQVEYNGGQVLVQETKVKVGNQGLIGSAGITYKGEDLSIGLSVRAGQPLIDDGHLNVNSVSFPQTSSAPVISAIASDAYTDDAELIPMITRFGMAYHPTSFFLLSTDLNYSSPLSSDNTSPDRQGVINYAVGMEFGPKVFKLIMGTFSNNSLFSDVIVGQTNQRVHLDYKGVSGGLSINTKEMDVLLGFVRQQGQGKAQIIAGSAEVQPVRAVLENLVLSWNFNLK